MNRDQTVDGQIAARLGELSDELLDERRSATETVVDQKVDDRSGRAQPRALAIVLTATIVVGTALAALIAGQRDSGVIASDSTRFDQEAAATTPEAPANVTSELNGVYRASCRWI